MSSTQELEASMGRVTTEALIENFGDVFLVERGLLAPDQVRSISITDALVDTGCTMLGMPKKLIDQLGLTFVSSRPGMAMNGPVECRQYGTIRLTIMGRSCPLDVMEVADSCPVLIGQIPLEYLDFVVDPRERKLIGNPAHGGVQMYEMY